MHLKKSIPQQKQKEKRLTELTITDKRLFDRDMMEGPRVTATRMGVSI